MASPQPDPEEQLIGLYRAAELYLIGQAAKILTATLTVGGIFAALPGLRRLTGSTVAALAAATGPLVQAMVTAETRAGRTTADMQLARLAHAKGGIRDGATPPPPPPGGGLAGTGGDEFFNLSLDHGDRAAQSIRADLTSALEDVRYRITRLPDDVYKAIAPQAGIVQVVDQNATPQQAQAAAWQTFMRSGVTGFTDKSGRDWALSSYVEMAVRTAAARAYNSSSMARMQAVGFTYFTVPPHVHPCPQCGPWQGAILTAGPNPDPSVHTDGTIEEATAAGLFHPNCRDVLTVWDAGTQPRPERRAWTGEDDLRYRATQRQRALEVELRKAKVAAAHGLTPETRADARHDVRRLRSRLADHVAKHGLARQSRREQPNLRMDVQTLAPWMPPGMTDLPRHPEPGARATGDPVRDAS